jgi:hypothetical protein
MTKSPKSDVDTRRGVETLDRRRMLQRLGLAAVAAYAAPTLISLTPARASGGSFSEPSRSSGPSGGGSRRIVNGSSGPSGPRRAASHAPRRSASSASGCSFGGGSGGSDGCRAPVRRPRVRRPRVFRRFFGGSD